jgi:hypothetical protein
LKNSPKNHPFPFLGKESFPLGVFDRKAGGLRLRFVPAGIGLLRDAWVTLPFQSG